MLTKKLNGHFIICISCDGKGQRAVWSFGVKEPEECMWCGGSGRNWQYSGGAIASYYGGPLIGRAALAQEQSDEG